MMRIAAFTALSTLLSFAGGCDVFMASFVSRPVYTAMPTAHSVLRSTLPRSIMFSMSSGKARVPSLSISSRPPSRLPPCAPAIARRHAASTAIRPRNVFTLMFGSSHSTCPSRSDTVCSTDSLLCPPVASAAPGGRTMAEGRAPLRSFRFVSPSMLEVSMYALPPSLLLASRMRSAGSCSMLRTSTRSPTSMSFHATWKQSPPFRSAAAGAAAAASPPRSDGVDHPRIRPSPPGATGPERRTMVALLLFTSRSALWRRRSARPSCAIEMPSTIISGPSVV